MKLRNYTIYARYTVRVDIEDSDMVGDIKVSKTMMMKPVQVVLEWDRNWGSKPEVTIIGYNRLKDGNLGKSNRKNLRVWDSFSGWLEDLATQYDPAGKWPELMKDADRNA